MPKIWGLEEEGPFFSNGVLTLSEFYWTVDIDGEITNKELPIYSSHIWFKAKRSNKSIIVLKATSPSTIPKMIATAAITKDVCGANQACVLSKKFGYREKVMSKSLSVSLLNEVIFQTVSGEVRKFVADEHSGDKLSSQEDKFHKRDRSDIIREILAFIDSSDCTGITSIIYKCNLNYNSANKIIDQLISRQLIAILEHEKNKKSFTLTEKGRSFLRAVELLSG